MQAITVLGVSEASSLTGFPSSSCSTRLSPIQVKDFKHLRSISYLASLTKSLHHTASPWSQKEPPHCRGHF